MLENGKATFLSGEALLANRRVKVKSGTTTDPVQVEYADAGEQAIGETEYGVADATLVEVRLVTAPGTHLCAAHDTFARGAVLYGEHDGLVSDASSGSAVGVALTAATGANDIVEWLPFSVLSTTAATVSVADSGSFTATATVEAALAEIYQHLMSVQKSVPISLGSITREDGTALTTQATTVTGFAQLSNKEVVINIPVDCTAGETLQFSVPLPQDIDITADLTVHVLASKGGNLDVLTLDCEVFPCAAGDLANTDIQDTAAQTIVAAGTELTFTCGADGLLASPSTVTVVLILGGTNDGDAVYIQGAWLEYKGKALTS